MTFRSTLFLSLAVLAFSLAPASAHAANLYWVGDDGANTSVASNWKTTDPSGCGSGDASAAPTTTDVAIFDADCDNGATINSTFSVLGVNFNSGYTGTVTQATTITVTVSTSGWTQAGGTFTGGDAAITVNDSLFSITGGTFTNTSGGLNIERSLTVNGGTFTNTSKTVTFVDSSSADDTTITCTGTIGGTVVITKNNDGDFINESGCSISLGASPTTTIDATAATDFRNEGTVTIDSGTWTVVGTGLSTMTNSGTITHSGNGWDLNDTNFTNEATGTVTYAGTAMSIEASFTQSGIFNLSGITITFDDSSSADDSTITCSGTLGGTVVITKNSDGDFINASGCSINLGANPSTTIDQDAVTDFTNNGTITIASGTWTVTDFDANNAAMINAGTITHSGTGWVITDTSLTNKTNFTIAYSGSTMSIERNLTQSGAFVLTGKTITFGDSSASDDSTLTCAGALGGTVVITKDIDGDFINAAGCSINLGASPTTTIDFGATNDFVNNGTITIASGTWTLNNAASTTSAILTNSGTITHLGNGWDFNDTSLTNNSSSTITYSGTTMSVERDITQNGTFTLTGITITFDDSNSSDDSTITCSNPLGGTVVMTKDSAGDFINGAGCSIDLGATPTSLMGISGTIRNDGTITVASGTWTIDTGGTTTGNAFINNGTITHSGTGWVITDSSLTNNASSTIAYSGSTISIERSLTQNGAFVLTGKTVTFNASSADDDSVITCTCTLGGTLVITKNITGADMRVSVGAIINLGASPTSTVGTGPGLTNSGTILISSGTWTVAGNSVNSSTATGLMNYGTITHSGTGWVIDDLHVTNATGATMAYSGTTIAMDRNFTQYGIWNLSGVAMTFDDQNGNDDTTITCTGPLGGTVTFSKSNAADFINSSGCSISLGASPSSTLGTGGTYRNDGTITIDSGTWTIDTTGTTTGNTFVNNGTITHSGNGWVITDSSLTNNASSTITYAGTAMSIERSLTQNGIFNLAGITITFDDTDSSDDSTITCTGTLGGTVVITKDGSGDFINGTGCSIALGASPTSVIGSAFTYRNDGTITIPSGTWTLDTTGTSTANTFVNNGTITHSGDGWVVTDTNLTNRTNATIAYSGSTMSIERNLTQSGAFVLTGKTITFNDNSASDDTTITCGTLGGTVVITKDTDGDFINSSGCTISLGASPTTTIDGDALTAFTNNGTITIASGTWTVTNVDTDTDGIINNGTITHSGNGWMITNASLTNSLGATITYGGTAIGMERDFTQNGTFDLTGITITFTDTTVNDDVAISCTGSLGGTMVITKSQSTDFTVASGCSINLGSNPTSTLGGGTTTNSGTIVIASGTWTLSPGNAAYSPTFTNFGTITHSGNGWDIDNTSLINNTNATISYSGSTMSIERNLTQSGTFILTGKTITFDDSDGSDDSTVTCATLGGAVVITKDSAGDFTNATGCNINLGDGPTTTMHGSSTNSFTNNGTLTVTSGTWTVNNAITTTAFTLKNYGTITHSGNGWDYNNSAFKNFTGAVTAYSGSTMSIERNLTQSGTFILTGKTITFDADDSIDDSIVIANGALGGTVVISKAYLGADMTVGTGTTISLGASPTSTLGRVTASTGLMNYGTVTIASGTWTVNADSADGVDSAEILNKGTITHSGNGWDINDTHLTNTTGMIIAYSGSTMSIERNFTQNGTFMLTGISVTLDDTSGFDDTTVICGSTLAGSIIVNKDIAGSDTTLGSSCTVGGSFTRTDGPITNPASAYTLTVQGDFSMSTTDTFGGSNLTLTLGGGNNQTITQNAGSIASPVIIDKSANTATLATALDLDSNLTITAGTLDASAAGCSGASCAITIAGNWTNSVGAGGFTARTGTVTFDGTSQTLAGTTTFYNFTKNVTNAATLTFPAGPTAVTTVAGTWNLSGAIGQLLSLRSSVTDTQWKIDPQGTRTLAYLDVKDSNNIHATAVNCGTGCTDSLNNTNWSFVAQSMSPKKHQFHFLGF